MKFPSDLIEARLVKRYKRFLADIIFNDGKKTTVYCPNPGSLLGLTKKDTKIWLQKSLNPKSKYSYIWKLVELSDGTLICIDTQIANKVIFESINLGKITELKNYDTIIPEPIIENGSRLDFLLEYKNGQNCFIEVKSSTLSRFATISEFPDCITLRGAKHLDILSNLKLNGFRTVQIYLILRNDTTSFKIAKDIDEIYYSNFQLAKKSGVEILVLQSQVSKKGIEIIKKRPIVL